MKNEKQAGVGRGGVEWVPEEEARNLQAAKLFLQEALEDLPVNSEPYCPKLLPEILLPETQNAAPETLGPTTKTRNPKSEIRNPKAGGFGCAASRRRFHLARGLNPNHSSSSLLLSSLELSDALSL